VGLTAEIKAMSKRMNKLQAVIGTRHINFRLYHYTWTTRYVWSFIARTLACRLLRRINHDSESVRLCTGLLDFCSLLRSAAVLTQSPYGPVAPFFGLGI